MIDDDEPVNFEEVAGLKHLDEQIEARLREHARPPDGQEALDPQLLRDLQAMYQPRAQHFQSGLDRVWGRLEQHDAVFLSHQQQQNTGPSDRPTFRYEREHRMERFFHAGRRWSARITTLVAAVLLAVLVSGLIFGLILVHRGGSNTAGNPQHDATMTSAPFTVTSVDLTVTPASIAGMSCGSTISLTYTVTFHIPAGTTGGTIHFMYTVNNGRGSTSASLIVGPGKTTPTSTFTSSGTLAPDHTYPGIAQILVNSPDAVQSPQVQPTGSCVTTSAFQVTSVDMAVSPTTIAGLACGTQTTVTYTATFRITPGSPGGTIQFQYTVDNGRGSTSASLPVAAGQTTATYSFTWKGALPADHTSPSGGGVIVTGPNQITSSLVAPTGACH